MTPILQKRIEDQAPRKRRALGLVLAESVPIADPKAEQAREYLFNRLGSLPDPLPKLGFHPSLSYFDSATGEKKGSFPTMLGAIRSLSGNVTSIHRTYIENGNKAPVHSPRKIMTPERPGSITGCAVRLYEPDTSLILAEGIETALALYVSLEQPAWACTSAHGLRNVEIPDRVTKVIIGADNDRNGVGQEAANALGRRLIRKGVSVKVMTPDKPGTDWLDVLREGEA